ncbi:unnamed protein product [Arctia plantaginis]|uniref:Uncharacterized protein n=1 Tax=Arctia plantaginis TaxID=874455 RepID=A0A8S1AWC2_ARCPL|nr:unnamed protein product [Arctia plantaginis]
MSGVGDDKVPGPSTAQDDIKHSLCSEVSKLRLKDALVYYEQILTQNNLVAPTPSELLAPDDAQENAPALEHPHAQASESGDTTPSILSEASTPDCDQENIPPINNDQQKSSKSAASSPSILMSPDVSLGNISPVDCL